MIRTTSAAKRTAKDADYRALAEFRHHIERYLDFSDQAARAAGIEPRQYQLLLAIRGLPEGIEPNVGALAQQLRSHHHSTVELINRAGTNDLVKRSRAGTHVFVRLTRKGERVLAQRRRAPERASSCRTGSGPCASTTDKNRPFIHEETKMKNPYGLRVVCCVFLIAALSLTGCKKKVAAATPATPAPAAQPAARPPAPTITLRATPGAINRGQSTSLQWDAKNASTVNIQPEVGSVQNTGTRSVTPASSVTYTATATWPGGSISDSARVTVNVPAAAAPTHPAARPDVRVSADELFRENVQTIYFDYDKAEVRQDQVSRLEADASWLKQQRGLKFTIEGHCDERGSEEYNLGLGDRRANVIKEFLVKQGVDASSINTVSYGEERPACKEANEGCYQKNRRAAFAASSAN